MVSAGASEHLGKHKVMVSAEASGRSGVHEVSISEWESEGKETEHNGLMAKVGEIAIGRYCK